MNTIQVTKRVQALAPALVNDASFTAIAIDCAGWDYVEVVLSLGAMDVDASAYYIQECDTSGGSYTKITGTDANTPGHTADHNTLFERIGIQRLGSPRKRYIEVVLTAGSGTTGINASAICYLTKGEIGADGITAASQGVTYSIEV